MIYRPSQRLEFNKNISLSRIVIYSIVIVLFSISAYLTYVKFNNSFIAYDGLMYIYGITVCLISTPIFFLFINKATYILKSDVIILIIYGSCTILICMHHPTTVEIVYLATMLVELILFRICNNKIRLNEIMPYLLTVISIIASIITITNIIANRNLSDFNTVGVSLLATCGISGLSHIIKHSHNKFKIFALFSVISLLLFLIVLKSRIGILSSIITILMFFSPSKKLTILSAIIIFFILIFCFKSQSSYGRAFIYQTSISMFDTHKHSLIGYGGNGFKDNYMEFQAEKLKTKDHNCRQRADNINHPLNDFLYLSINHGLILLIILGAGVYYIVFHTKINTLQLTILITLILYSLFSYPFRFPMSIILLSVLLTSISSKRIAIKELHVKTRYVYLALILLQPCILYPSFTNIAYKVAWEKAYTLSQLGQCKEAFKIYDSLFSKYKETSYIYNYASYLLKNDKPQKALYVISQCTTSDYEIQLLKAEILKANGFNNHAISCYKKAYSMCPNRFNPLFGLYRIYKEANDTCNQKKYAKIILTKPIKIESNQINIITKTIKSDL